MTVLALEIALNEAVPVGEACFATLVERQSKFVFRIAWAVLRNCHDAEDVVQETFLRLYKNGAWKRIDDEKAFLARAAWRISVDRIRARRRDDIATGDTADSAIDPEQSAITSDWSAVVHRLMDALPEDLRQPLALSSVEEMSSPEIARVMGISEGTVRTRIMRARQLLKQKLEGLLER